MRGKSSHHREEHDPHHTASKRGGAKNDPHILILSHVDDRLLNKTLRSTAKYIYSTRYYDTTN